MIKKINIFYNREIPWSYPDNVDRADKNENNNNNIKDLIKLAPNKEEREQLSHDLNELRKEKQKLAKLCHQEIKLGLNNLKYSILKDSISNEEFYVELEKKIKELSNNHEKSPEDNKEIRTIKVQLALLNQAFSQSKNNVW